MIEDFPGGPVAENVPAGAGDAGLILGPGGPDMPQGKSSALNRCSRTRKLPREKPAGQRRVAPLSTIGGSPHSATKNQHSHK